MQRTSCHRGLYILTPPTVNAPGGNFSAAPRSELYRWGTVDTPVQGTEHTGTQEAHKWEQHTGEEAASLARCGRTGGVIPGVLIRIPVMLEI